MISETGPMEEGRSRISFRPLKQKRRFRSDDFTSAEPMLEHGPTQVAASAAPRKRIRRSGNANVQWRRVTPPTELLEALPKRTRSPILAQVVDKIKGPRPGNAQRQSLWSFLRDWAVAFR